MAENKNNLVSVKLGEYAPPERVEYEKTTSGWVEYGLDNLFPQHLIELYKASTTHHAVTDKVVQMLIGTGIKSSLDQGKEKIRTLNLNEQLEGLAFDFVLQGGFFAEVIRNKKGEELIVNHLPFENCRFAITEEDEDEPNGIFYSRDWANHRKKGNTPEFVPRYDAQSGDARSVLWVMRPTPGSLYYPSPSYEGAIDYIEAEIQIGIYHNNQLANGLFPSFIANMKMGVPDDEARREVTREFERTVSGVKNAGKFMVTFSDPGADYTPEFIPFPLSDADKQYQFLSEECTDKILRGHRVTNPILFGVRDGGGLGNNANEMTEAKELFMEDVVYPDRLAILKGLLPLFNAVGVIPDWDLDRQDVEADPEKSYDKGQMEMVTLWIEKHQLGTLPTEQARALAVSMLGMDEAAAEAMFPDKIQLSKKKEVAELTDEWGDALVKALQERAESIEDLEADGWEVIKIEEAGCSDEEDEFDLEGYVKNLNLAAPQTYANPGEGSDWGDSGLYKLRYRYSQNISEKSRKFCKDMVAISRRGYIFRKEDIDTMSNDPSVNGQFAPKGETTYPIFDWKGGVYCHHKWERVILFRKRNDKGQFLPPSRKAAKTERGMSNDKKVDNVPYVPQKGQEGVAPINTRTRGKLN